MTVILEYDELAELLEVLQRDHLGAGGYRLHLARPCRGCLSVTVERRALEPDGSEPLLWHWHYHRHQSGPLLLLNHHPAENEEVPSQ